MFPVRRSCPYRKQKLFRHKSQNCAKLRLFRANFISRPKSVDSHTIRYCLGVKGINILIETVSTLLALAGNGGRTDAGIRKKDPEMPGGGRNDTGSSGRARGD